MVDTQALKNSGIIDRMQAIAGILRQEAVEKKFYDEIRSTKDDFQYAFASLQSLETLIEQLGINLYELESLENPTLSNAYTQNAIEIRKILSNENNIYARSTDYSAIEQSVVGRSLDNDNVEVRERVVPLSGLTAFFVTNGVYEEYLDYDAGMRDLETLLPDGEVKDFISTYRQAVLDYKLIFETGAAVSALAAGGTPVADIDFNKVKEYWNSQKTSEQQIVWDLISPLIGSRGDGTEDWLDQIIDVQKNEVINHDKVSIRNESENGKEYYRLDIQDTPKRIIDVPKLKLSAKLANPPERIFADEVNMMYEGEQIFDDKNIGSFLDFVAGDKSSYRVPRFDGEWYGVEAADGTKYLASIADENSVYAQFTFEGDSPRNGLLVFGEDGKAKTIVVEDKPIDIDAIINPVTVELMNTPKTMSIPISLPFNPKDAKLIKAPISELGIEKVDVKLSIADMYEYNHEIKAELRFDPNGGTWKEGGSDIRVYDAELETEFTIIDAPVRDGYTFVCWEEPEYQPQQKITVSQDHMFTVKWKPAAADTTTEAAKPDENTESGNNGDSKSGVKTKVSLAKARVSGIKAKTWTGKALSQSPKVKLSGKTLASGRDYTVTYKNNKNVGKATVTITGKDGYTGKIKKTFKINPKGTTIDKLIKAKRAVTVKWKKQPAKMSKSRITCYQIQLATDKSFTKNKKTVTVKGYKTVSQKVKGLKGGKKYYVRIRTYKKVNQVKYYSSWSKIKTVKTRK